MSGIYQRDVSESAPPPSDLSFGNLMITSAGAGGGGGIQVTPYINLLRDENAV